MKTRMDARSVEKIYSAYSGIYDHIFRGVVEPRIEEAIRIMDLKPGDHVLEVGVGTGLSLPYYPRHCTVTGIDLSGKMIAQARKKVKNLGLDNVTLKVMNAEGMGFPGETFDHVFAAFVITTVPDPIKVLREMIRVVRKRGQVILLNHFRSSNSIIGKVEDLLSPMFARLGWRTDVKVDDILRGTPLRIVSVSRIKGFDLWKIYTLSKDGLHHSPASP